jgi:hypothetical protein
VVLPEKMVKDGAVLLVYALHLVDVLSHLNPEPNPPRHGMGRKENDREGH